MAVDTWAADFARSQHKSTTVLALGTHQGFPAVLTRSPIYRQEWVWSPSGRKGKVEHHPPGPDFQHGPL